MSEHYTKYPDLSKVSQICLDLETRDPNLKTKGCGGVRDDGEVLGFALAWRELRPTALFGLDPGVMSIYLPIAHSEGNLHKEDVLGYLHTVFKHNIPVVGANIAYDLEWMRHQGISVTGQKKDVQIAEALINENQKSYSLNALSEKWLGQKKLTDDLSKNGASLLGCSPKDVITKLAELPADLVAPYARMDAELTLRVMELQEKVLSELGLLDVWELECCLVDVLQDVRALGICLDVPGTIALKARLSEEAAIHTASLTKLSGMEVNVWSHDDVLAAATKLGLTGLIVDNKGKQSFPAPWMLQQVKSGAPSAEFFAHVLKLRQLSKAGGAFLQSFLELEYKGRLRCNYHQTRGDRGGTRSGRLCVSPDTLIEMPRDLVKYPDGVPMREVKVGDLVYSFDWQKHLCLKKVLGIGPTKVVETVIVSVLDEKTGKITELTCTPDHLIRRYQGKWQSAASLNKGDKLLSMGRHEVISVRPGPIIEVWDMEVEDTHTFIGSNVTLHNSASNPNLQQIPSRNEDLAPRIRSLFLPEEGMRLVSFDHNQIEPRITVHYSSVLGLPGAEEAVSRYSAGDVDYHQLVSDMTGLSRYAAKQLNLGLAYGMGKVKMSEMLGIPLQEAEAMFCLYHKRVPFVRELGKACEGVASRRKYVKTISGRRRNFNLYGPLKWKTGIVPLAYEEAVEAFGPGVTQYFVHKAMNAVIQGTAADILKKNMVELNRMGYIPHLSIHDELVFSIPYGAQGDADIKQIKTVMEHPTDMLLKIPLRVNVKAGPNWGSMESLYDGEETFKL